MSINHRFWSASNRANRRRDWAFPSQAFQKPEIIENSSSRTRLEFATEITEFTELFQCTGSAYRLSPNDVLPTYQTAFGR
jgi:hypothetical protein